jgi:hypothetical protein
MIRIALIFSAGVMLTACEQQTSAPTVEPNEANIGAARTNGSSTVAEK